MNMSGRATRFKTLEATLRVEDNVLTTITRSHGTRLIIFFVLARKQFSFHVLFVLATKRPSIGDAAIVIGVFQRTIIDIFTIFA